jgi:HD-GYP domain-containing protein (c-di-GMP phosphodiesterase class II)
MNIRMDQLIKAIAVAFDIVEGELLGASTHHGKRIAVLSAAMGRCFDMTDSGLSALTTCALFHDSALTEYILAEREGSASALRLHCQYGQRNAESLLVRQKVDGFVLYHHERADGLGPFGKAEGEFPMEAELIAIADMLDVTHHLQTISPDRLPYIRDQITQNAGTRFTRRAAEVMLRVLDQDMLAKLKDSHILDTANRMIPAWVANIENAEIYRIAELTARIIDYKSVFTKRHSVQIANKAWLMCQYYGYDKTLQTLVYLAAALHDIGKLATPSHILEKPGKLTYEEFEIIKEHARLTYDLLKDIQGLETVCEMACGHHEKLDGSGYSFGKNADEMGFNTRLIACIDVYQAVSETRPYHDGRSHEETMPILYGMARNGLIDEAIVRDLDNVMAEYSNQDVPAPPDAASL